MLHRYGRVGADSGLSAWRGWAPTPLQGNKPEPFPAPPTVRAIRVWNRERGRNLPLIGIRKKNHTLIHSHTEEMGSRSLSLANRAKRANDFETIGGLSSGSHPMAAESRRGHGNRYGFHSAAHMAAMTPLRRRTLTSLSTSGVVPKSRSTSENIVAAPPCEVMPRICAVGLSHNLITAIS